MRYFNRYSCVSQNTAVNIADCYYSNTEQAAQMYEKFADHTSGFTGINEWLSELTTLWEIVWETINSYHEYASDYWIESTERMLQDICKGKLNEDLPAHDLLSNNWSPLRNRFQLTCISMLQSYNKVTAYGTIEIDKALVKIEQLCKKPTTQEDMLKFIQDQLHMNIVTCGNCGSVLIVRTTDENIKCPHCTFHSEQCDYPDLFYPGWDENLRENREERAAKLIETPKETEPTIIEY